MENLKETVDIVVNSRYPEMNREGRELLAQVLIRKELEKGEMLLNEGQISRHMVFVGKGMLRQFYYKNGKDVTEHFSYEGCILMCIESLLKQEPTHLMAFRNSTRTLQPTLAPSSGDHQTSSVITHCILPADDPGNTQSCSFGSTVKNIF